MALKHFFFTFNLSALTNPRTIQCESHINALAWSNFALKPIRTDNNNKNTSRPHTSFQICINLLTSYNENDDWVAFMCDKKWNFKYNWNHIRFCFTFQRAKNLKIKKKSRKKNETKEMGIEIDAKSGFIGYRTSVSFMHVLYNALLNV